MFRKLIWVILLTSGCFFRPSPELPPDDGGPVALVTFGPVQVTANDRDGSELDETTWDEDGHDSDGNVHGNRSGVSYDIGYSWTSVTVPQGATINSATLEIFEKFVGTVPLHLEVVGFDVDNVGVFSSSNRPSQIAQTTATVLDTFNIGESSDESFYTLNDISSIIQEIVDRGSWSSGNALGVVVKDNGNSTNVRVQFQDHNRSSGDAARITIDYTAAAAEERRKVMFF